MKRKSISISEFEKKEISQATFKRNKMYLDLNKIEKDEKVYSIKRRQPYAIEKSPKSQKVNSKIQDLFRNSFTDLQNKLGDEIKRFKQRLKHSNEKLINSVETGFQTTRITSNNPQIEEETVLDQQCEYMQKIPQHFAFNQNQHISQNKIKGIPIDKQISREYLNRYSVERNYSVDQRSFNNFYITQHDLSKTQDLKKLSPRHISFVQEHINDLNYNTQKTYQKLYYSTKPMNATFKLSVQNSKTGRKFFNPTRPENIAKTALDPEKIKKSFSETSNFKPNKIDNFYKFAGRELPHQLDQRKLSPNCNYYKDSSGKIIKEDVDYAVRKMYDDLVRKQKEDHYRKKNPEFTRDEICDQRYFNEMIKRQKKLLLEKGSSTRKSCFQKDNHQKSDY